MKRKMTAIAAAALVFTAAAASCGKVDSNKSSVTVNVNSSSEASSESASGSTEASSEKKASEKTSEKTTKDASEASSENKTEDKSEASSEEKTEEATEKQTEAQTEAPTEKPTEKQTEASTQAPQFTGTSVSPAYLGQPFTSFSGVYGTQYFEQVVPSCIPIGDDSDMYVYEYSGMKVQCYSEGGVKYAASIHIDGSSYSTPEGIHPGSSKSEVEAAYGSGIVQGNGSILYRGGAYNTEFTMNGDTVSAIDYDLNY